MAETLPLNSTTKKIPPSCSSEAALGALCCHVLALLQAAPSAATFPLAACTLRGTAGAGLPPA